MENNSSSSVLIALVFAAVLIAVFVATLANVSPRSDFNQPADIATIEQAIVSSGLQVCAQGELNWSATPGFVSGKYYDVSTDCSIYDPNKPGARLWVAEFSNARARDSALRSFETMRRHIGSGAAWSKGPLVILIDGNQKDDVVIILREAITNAGAQ
jgi:deferrochelatase/peroxidase EfeB